MKLLIVDDEDYTREGLIDGIQWKEFGIEEIFQARDGREALSIAKWFKPDIVLTDVKMPKLNGIEFAKELAAINSESKIIFMSGYMEIDYLKSAIQLSAVDYIEKPIDLSKIKSAIMKSIEDINTRRQTEMLTADHKELQQQKLANALICKDNNKEMITHLCKEVGFPVSGNYVCIILWDKESNGNSERIYNDILQFFKKRHLITLCNYLGEGKYLLIISYINKSSSRISLLYRNIVEEKPYLILGIGFEANDILNIYNSYQTALLAMNCAFYDEEEHIFMVDDEIMSQRGVEPSIYGKFVKTLTEQPADLRSWCEALFADLKKHKFYRKENIQILLASFVTAMINEHPELLDYIVGVRTSEEIEQMINHYSTLTEIQNLIMRLIDKIEEKQENQSKYSRIIRGVMDYIAKHYGNSELSVAQIAEEFHFSATYLNVLFKQEMQVTLKQYLSDYRIEKAKRMLENDYYKITEISELCGYANGNYFAKVFKEATDRTPIEYRKQSTE